MDAVVFNDEFKQYLLAENQVYDVGCVGVVNLVPESSGYVKLASSCSCDQPIIAPNYLAKPDN